MIAMLMADYVCLFQELHMFRISKKRGGEGYILNPEMYAKDARQNQHAEGVRYDMTTKY